MKNRITRLFCSLVLAAVALSGNAFTVDTLTIASKQDLIPEPMKVVVVTPDVVCDDCSLPVVYLLNGYGGDYRQWLKVRPNLPELADDYGFFMVLPSGMNSWYWDSPVDKTMQMESFITGELVPELRARYKAMSADPAYNAVTGLSMGGHGALWLAMRHPDIWGNMGTNSGGVNIMPFPEKWEMARWLGPQQDNYKRWEQYTVVNNLEMLKDKGQNIIIDCGTEDFFRDVNAEVHAKLLDLKIPHDYISRPGKHNYKYWSNSILFQLLYFDQCFRRATAAKENAK